MAKKKVVSKFKQSRSLNTKQKIVEAAERYFCQYGYYGSSIQKLTNAANVSIGSFYFYFKNKEELLIEVYRRQNESFLQTINNSFSKVEQYRDNRKSWLHDFILDLIKTYGNSGNLRAELKVLDYENSEVANERRLIKKQTVELMMKSIKNSPIISDVTVKHPQIALLFVIDMMDATYERIANRNNTENKEDIIEECFDAIYKYLFLINE